MTLMCFIKKLKRSEPLPVTNNDREIEEVKQQAHDSTVTIKDQAINRSMNAAKSFEKTAKTVYDVAEKISLATGRRHA